MPPFCREVDERYFCQNVVVEAARVYWRFHGGRDDVFAKKSPNDIAIYALDESFGRILADKPTSTGDRGGESTLTALSGELAIARRAGVTRTR